MPAVFHFISCRDRFVLDRGRYETIEDVEARYPEVVSWQGPFSEVELLEEISRFYHPPEKSPFRHGDVVAWIHSDAPRLERSWPD